MTTVAARGRPLPSGQALTAVGLLGSLRSLAVSPGCWMFTNMLFPSGVVTTPVISQPFGPVKKRRIVASGGIGRQHLVVANIGVVALVEHTGRDVRLDPEHAACIEPEAIRRAKDIPFDGAMLVGFGHGRIAAEHKDVPLKPAGLGITVLLAPADDMAIDVLGAGIGRIDCRSLVRTTVAVIGERAVDLLRGRVHRDPLRTVHLRGADFVCRGAGLYHDLRLAREAGTGVETMLTVHQRQPFALPIGVEPGDIEGAAFEEPQVRGAIVRRVGALTDKLVDVLAAFIVPHVDDHAVVSTEGHHRPLVFEAPQRRMFHWLSAADQMDRFRRSSRSGSARWDGARHRSAGRAHASGTQNPSW